MKISVFTPTYNRGYTLQRLYESLKTQTFRDFEWIIINDGSTDDTDSIVKQFAEEENDFNIIYKRIPNGGKHRAVNIGTQMAKGELFYIVDSDDWLPENSLEKIFEAENQISNNTKAYFAGVCGLKGEDRTHILGATFDGNFIDATYLERKKNNIYGDKAEVYYTSIIKKYPFPEFEGENFIPESTSWNLIAADGLKLRYFNDIVYYCNYLPDGLTKQGDNKIINNPKGYGLLIRQNIEYNQINGMTKWNEIRKYYKLLKADHSLKEIAGNLGMNPVVLKLRMTGLNAFYRIYR